MMRLARCIAAVALLLCIARAAQGCVWNPDWGGTIIVSAPGGSFYADPAVPVGQIITQGISAWIPAPSKQTRQYIPIARCALNTKEVFGANRPSIGFNLFSTNVPGIGYQLFYSDGTPPNSYYSDHPSYLLYYPSGVFQIKFVKTGPISPGVVPADIYGTDSVDGFGPFVIFKLNSPIIVTVPTCRIEPASVSQTVNFGDVASTDFSGIGTGAASQSFSIQLQCDAAVPSVGLTFDATQDPSGQPGTLRITGGTGTATGVGIQVLGQDGKPIDWKKRVQLPIVSGEARIDMSARYLQTAKEIRGGSAGGVMTFTITY